MGAKIGFFEELCYLCGAKKNKKKTEMNNWKRFLPDLLAVVAFAVIAFVYFMPAVGDGRILNQHDAVAGIGAGQEASEYHARTGELTRWTNGLFGGMPTYQIAPSYESTDAFSYLVNLYHLYLPTYVWYVFALLLGFYILLRAFDFKVWMAALGAVVWAFSSYFFIIIAAGHIWKVMALAYIPPTIAGMVLCYKGKYLQGAAVTALFVAMQVKANHVQMSYYFLFCMAFMALGFLCQALKEKQLAQFCKATAVLVVAGVLGVLVNLSNLYHTYEYSKETMRGKSELVKADTGNQTNSGLDRDYITQWSYGIDETWSLLVPNVKGGASSRGSYFLPLSQDDTAMKHANPDFFQVYSQFPQYWGDQPGTSGPVYAGALVIALFLLGAIIVKGPLKWALLAATLLSFLFAWGKNFMPFTDFCIDYIPMYAKFRAVSSALVVAEFTIPLLAMLGLKELCTEDGFVKYGKQFFVAFGATAAITLLFAFMPGLFFDRFLSLNELGAIQNGVEESMQGALIANITDMRQEVFKADALRSFLIVLLGFAALLLYGMKKIKQPVLAGCLIVICLADMWQVNKRYLSDDMFVPASDQTNSFAQTPTDKQILEDKSLDYRVLNYANSTFNENNTSYWHKSIGGYHAAKLRRYQELIDAHISKEMTDYYQAIYTAQGDMSQVSDSVAPVINMLNTKYLILPAQDNSTMPVLNPNAYGNAWFVDELQYVKNANEELAGLGKVSPKHVALVDEKFAATLGDAKEVAADSTAQVQLVAYEPNALRYEVNSGKGGVVVFSEIYYPGWTATIDGQEAPVGRADYVLRAMKVPAGKHVIEMSFQPKSITVTETIAWIALVILVLLLLGVAATEVMKTRKKA